MYGSGFLLGKREDLLAIASLKFLVALNRLEDIRGDLTSEFHRA